MLQMDLNWLDILIAVLLLWGAARGLRAGFIRRFMSLAGLICGFWGAAKWSAPLVNLVEAQFRAVSHLAGILRQYISIPAEVALVPVQPGGYADAIHHVLVLPLPADMRDKLAAHLANLLGNMSAISGSTIGEVIYRAVASLALHAVAFLVILSIIRAISVLLAEVMTQIMASGTASSLTNRLLGAGLGLTESLAVLVVLMGLLMPIANLTGGRGLGSLVVNSKVAPFLAAIFMWAVRLIAGGG